MAMKKVVLIQGAFDILHAAHIRAFKFAKAQGDYLIVALNTDKLIANYKKREPVIPWAQRKVLIEACRYVDMVIPANEFSPLKLLKKHRVNVYVVSREWEGSKAVEFLYMKSTGGRVCFSRRSKSISSTAIKAKLLAQRTYNNGNSDNTSSRSFTGSNIDGSVSPANINGDAAGIVREGEPREAGTGIF